nr:MAG: replication initiator protein [Microvirus sp.]
MEAGKLQGSYVVPCGRCVECLERRRSEWTFRIKQEWKEAEYAYFITLTLNDDYAERMDSGVTTLSKKILQNYFKKIRKQAPNLRYYAVGEYGSSTRRAHYHGIIFNCPADILMDKWSQFGDPMGFVKVDPVNEATIHYVAGYVIEKYGDIDFKTGKTQKWTDEMLQPFALMSKGLGKIYLKHAAKFHKSQWTTTVTNEGGTKGNLPRYYRLKIFDEWQQKQISLDNLEKMIENELTPDQARARKKAKLINLKNKLKNKKL